MKAPDDIKEALRKCIGWNSGYSCGECPYWNGSAMCKPELCNDAIAYIEQLEKKKKWISVKDRMPEDFKTVIVLRDDLPGGLVDVTWVIEGSWGVPKGVNVTHWMPMPEPPKDGLE